MRDDLLPDKVRMIREECLRLCVNAGKGHVTSAFSCAEIVTVLYYEVMRIDPHRPDWSDRDRFIMSKNHASVITYPILADLGFVSHEEIETFMHDGSVYGTHSRISIPGVDFAGGALGIGIGAACGLAYAARQDRADWLTFCVIGDGECYEGSVWEAAMFAAHYKLGNLVVILDRNRLTITDYTEHMLALDPLQDRFASFGWETGVIDGHSLPEIRTALGDVRHRDPDRPLCVIANTLKGHGIDFMEDRLFMHGVVPTGDKVALAFEQLRGGDGYAHAE